MNFMPSRPGFSEENQMFNSSSSSYPSPSTLHHFTNGEEDAADARASQVLVEREHMFDKVVTPSDVGKLNRLVIPKQHAEKYFPLDSSTNEKGLLLNFEDRNGKPWRFRYSYWNSSQSYVMTKGWSRFVKEKKLDAGDIVSFQRGVGELGKDRLFIDWRRRQDVQPPPPEFHTLPVGHQFSFQRNPLFLQPAPSREYSHFLQASASYHHYQSGHSPYPYNATVVNGNPCPPGSILYVRSAPGAVVGGGEAAAAGVGLFGPQQVGIMGTQRRSGGVEQMVYESVPVVQGKAAAAKRLRLFGVNMDCPVSDSDESDMLSHSIIPFDSSSSSSPPLIPSLHQLRTYGQNQDKGKGSMSLDLDI